MIEQISDNDAIALSGTTDPSGLVYPTLLQANWGAAILRGFYDFLQISVPDLKVVPIDGNADAIGVLAGVCEIAGLRLEYSGAFGDGGAIDNIPDNSVQYIWGYNNAGALTPNRGTSLPDPTVTPFVPLARVTMASGVITSIVDLRGQAMLRTIAMATASVAGVVKQAGAVANLSQTISDPPTQAQVTAIQTGLNALLTSLRTAVILAT